uniref:Uncharacterized protein n=1 Tax=Anguilla anguilla TaxID=7936 RepID=A0A0E9SRS1_ANGAN
MANNIPETVFYVQKQCRMITRWVSQYRSLRLITRNGSVAGCLAGV